MFSYFGSKSKIAHLYPEPRHGKIIEPFAGSARYSLLHWENREVDLYDANVKLIALWQYLQSASKQDMLNLPLLKWGESLNDFDLTEPEKWLIGFELCRGKTTPRRTPSRFSNWESARSRIASNVDKIRGWNIHGGDYRTIANQEATWFIDPPYILEKATGMKYTHGHDSIDYEELAEWCKSRKGQVIVCGGTHDEWLPFDVLRETRNQRNQSTRALEKIYLQ